MLSVASQLQLRAKHIPDSQIFSFDLEPNRVFTLGRLRENDIVVSWDKTVSREHATLELGDGSLTIRCRPSATNGLYFEGAQSREVVLKPGEFAVIGATQFELLDHSSNDVDYMIHDLATGVKTGPRDAEPEDAGFDEFTYGSEDLKSVEFLNTGRQMELLAQLPELIATASQDVDLATLLAGLLLKAIPQAIAVAAAHYDVDAVTAMSRQSAADDTSPTRPLKPTLMRVQTRDDYEGRFAPSRRLVSRALVAKECALHIASGGDASCAGGCTMSDDLNWAFCVPIPGASSVGWCLYVSGKGSPDGGMFVTDNELKGDLRFTQLLAQFLGSVRQVRKLKEQTTQLSSFFSPKVVESLTNGSTKDILTPSERDITVLFCDVRGFSRKSEQSQGNLMHLLDCVKAALSAMTQGILQQDGAIADFQGDAALGFWGWPSAIDEGAIPACFAALAVQAAFAESADRSELLDGFSVGVGIAHGRAIAGQIGTAQQAKIGVFGPVVNQGSRLEGMTRQFGVSICMDEGSAEFVRSQLKPHQARVRRLARVRPKGMDTSMAVSELLPPFGSASCVTDATIAAFEAALEEVIAGRWDVACEQLAALPDEGPKSFLLQKMAKHDNRPPADWDGAFSLVEK